MINSSVLLSAFSTCKTNRFTGARILYSRLLVPYFVFISTLFFSNFSANAQFISNWSFEDRANCPTTHSQFRNNVADWLTPLGPLAGTPDYFSTCGTYNLSGLSTPILPINGNSFAGIYAEFNNSPTYTDYKEYITSHLSIPLVAGVTYTFSFYTAHVYGAVVPGSPSNFAGTTDLPDAEQGYLGVVFSAGLPMPANTGNGSGGNPRYNSIRDDFNPLNRVLIPKTNTNVYGEASRNKWVFVSLKYTAKGGEEYMTVGQFRPGGTSLGANYSAYYLFDGFSSSVSPLDNCMEIGSFDALGETSKTGISDLIGFAGGTTGWPANVPNGHMVIESKSKGFVITRVSSSAAIVNPVEGMLIYDIAAACVKLYNGTVWKCLAKDCI